MRNLNPEYVANAIPYVDMSAPFDPFGAKRHSITREELARMFDASDRSVRRAIEEARKMGYFIINDQNGAGYYRTDDLDTIERQYKQDTSRAMAILARRKAMRKFLRENGRMVK